MRMNKSVEMSEGQIKEICASIDHNSSNERLRERAILISLSLLFTSDTSGKYFILQPF